MGRNPSILRAWALIGFISCIAYSCNRTTAVPAVINPVQPSPVQVSTDIWDVAWLPNDTSSIASTFDQILDGTGLQSHGSIIVQDSIQTGVNPLFAIAMFRKEASFASVGSRARANSNPGNIIATGFCKGLSAGSSCRGDYGEISTDGRFGVYAGMADGIKAYFMLLSQEYKPGTKHNCSDLACVINIYCPPSDCNTSEYITQITQWMSEYRDLLAGNQRVLAPAPLSTQPSISSNVTVATISADPSLIPESPGSDNPATRQKIAFVSRDFEIYLINADGSGLANLTNNSAEDSEPAWSPDGTRIAFLSRRNGAAELYVMDANGANVRQLTNLGVDLSGPVWSPDGLRIAFASNKEPDIYWINADGTNLTEVYSQSGFGGRITWAPNSRQLLFDANAGSFHLWLVDLDGSNLQMFAASGRGEYMPAWSPDGSQVAFTSERNGGHIDIWVTNSDESQTTNLTSQSMFLGQNMGAVWSPDSSQIAFMSISGLYVVDIGSNELHKLGPAYDYDNSIRWAWSPNGRELVYAIDGLFVATIDGTDTIKLSDNIADDTRPVWQPAMLIPTSTPMPADVESTPSSAQASTVMVYVPAGDFLMGSTDEDPLGKPDEKPQHKVSLAPFWIDQTDVTNALYELCFKAGACQAPASSASETHPQYFGNPTYANYPIFNVTWNDATAYCNWAGRRLPTEAEWEKAARGTDGRLYPWGNNPPTTAQLPNGNSGDTSEVGQYPSGASPYGALDMTGIIWQWVNDWYGDTYYNSSPAENPSGPTSGQLKVVRGSISYAFEIGRVAERYAYEPTQSSNRVSFRCARSP